MLAGDMGGGERMNCAAVKSGKVARRGKASLEYVKDGNKYYFCMGYIDLMTDEFLPACAECKQNVRWADEPGGMPHVVKCK